VAEARRNNVGGAIAVVDAGGHVVALERLDGTFAAGAEISIGKARTAALFRRPTSFFENVINGGRTAMAALPSLPDFTPLQGGVPIEVDGQVIGAIGISGAASAKQDEEIAILAAAAVEDATMGAVDESGPATTTYLDHDMVAAAFAKGQPLLEVPGYKVHASRRDAPGIAEVHLWETDVIYVLDGEATFVTGGTVVEPNATEPGQIRGTVIEGGTEHHLAKGDVIVVPNNQPHWFKEVSAPFLYFVVKPIAPKGDVS
ncbi:MAG TPA: heme-binding protein, partial [Geminicoccaceae bacterium]|nr:heme-binding protein [Geminicoccaceae bacterium]